MNDGLCKVSLTLAMTGGEGGGGNSWELSAEWHEPAGIGNNPSNGGYNHCRYQHWYDVMMTVPHTGYKFFHYI